MPFTARTRGAAALAVFVFAVSVAFATLPSAGSAAAEPAKGSTNLCRIKGFSSGPGKKAARASTVAHASSVATGLTKFVLEKAVGVNIERYALMGMSNLIRLVGGDFTPDSPEQQVLNQLNAINVRLGEMEAQIGRVGDSVNQLTAERREKDLDQEVKGICEIANHQMYLYRLFSAAVEAGADLGRLLNGPNPSLADVPGPGQGGKTPRQLVQRDVEEFVDQYKITARNSDGEIGTLSRALVPDPDPLSNPTVLKSYGLVLMSQNRFLSRDHSEALRALYKDVAEIRALTSWMAAEYWNARGITREEDRVWSEFVSDSESAEAGLPRMIPPGAIVDLGSEPRPKSVNGRAMWLAPTGHDLGWLPSNYAYPSQFSIDEVSHELDALNGNSSHKGWHAPDKQELIALMSNHCSANPDKPNQPPVGCTNAVPGGANIAAYLQKINSDKHWQQLFCQSSVNPKCPPGAGPKGIRQPPHAFIWTSDKHSQRLICGSLNDAGKNNGTTAVRFETYAGYHTLGPIKHEVFPHLPKEIPHLRHGVGADKHPWVEEGCGNFVRQLAHGDPGKGVKRNHLFEGVLLATRFTDSLDATLPDQLDFMAQPIRR